MSNNTLLDELREVMDAYFATLPSSIVPITTLASKASVSESTLRRIYNKKNIPTGDNLLKILAITSGKNSIADIANQYGGEIFNHLKNCYQHLVNKETTSHISFDLADELEDFNKYLVFTKIDNINKVRIQDITDWIGEPGKIATEKLIEKKLLSVKDNGYLTRNVEGSTSLPPQLMKKHMSNLINNFFKPENALNNGLTMAGNIVGTTSIVNFRRVMKILTKTNKEIFEILSKDESSEVQYFFTQCYDTMTFKGLNKEGITNE